MWLCICFCLQSYEYIKRTQNSTLTTLEQSKSFVKIKKKQFVKMALKSYLIIVEH